jgi:hypothetical protein
MSKPLPSSDHRAVRHYLEPGDYGKPGDGTAFVPTGRINPDTWKSLVGLSDSVAIETSDAFATELERAGHIGWSWLNIHDGLPKESPAQYQTLSALETFQASTFNALNGWYRVAGFCLRCALDDMLLGLYYQNRPGERQKFDAITEGEERSPGLGEVLSGLKKDGLNEDLLNRVKDWYHDVLSVHVHRRSDGTIWSSNGPVYVPDAFRTWLGEYERTYLLMCELIDAALPSTGAVGIAQSLQR